MAARDLIEAKLELARRGFLPSDAERERLRSFARSLEWRGVAHEAADAVGTTRRVHEAGPRSRRAAWQLPGSSAVAGVVTIGGALVLGVGFGFAWGRQMSSPPASAERPLDLGQAYEARATAGPADTRSAIVGAEEAPSALHEHASATAAPGAGIESASPSVAQPPAVHPQQQRRSMRGAANQSREATSRALAQPRKLHTGEGSGREPIDGELALLGRAEWALRHGNTVSAFDILAELERRYPRSVFSEERAGAQTMARCQAKLPGAREDADRFLREHPNSVYAARVRRSCRANE